MFRHLIILRNVYCLNLVFGPCQGKVLCLVKEKCFARIGKSLARCLFPKRSKDLVEKRHL